MGPFAHSKACHAWPLLRPWSRVRPAVRVAPLGLGPNLSLDRLSGIPLRWSHACLLQLPATDTAAKPDLIKVSCRPVPALAKHSERLRPSSGSVNSYFLGNGPFRFTSRRRRAAARAGSTTWIDPAALRNIVSRASDLPAPLSSSTGRRIPRSTASSVPPRRSSPPAVSDVLPGRPRRPAGAVARATVQRRSASWAGPAAGVVRAETLSRRSMNQFGAGPRPPLTNTVAVMPAMSGTPAGTWSMRMRTGTR